jgi:hypothetical protein
MWSPGEQVTTVAQPSDKLIVDLADLKQRKARRKKRHSRLKPWLSLLFGLALAVAWHFLHHIGEIYQPTPADPYFWFHLVVEGTIALYATLLFFIAWTLWERFRG